METSVGSILGGAFGQLRERPMAVGVWCLIYTVATVAMTMLMAPANQALLTPAGDPTAALQAFFGQMLLFWLVLLLLFTILYAAAQRAILRPNDSGFAYLGFGMDEVHLLVLAVIMTIGFFAVALVLMIPLFAIASVFTIAAGPMVTVPIVILLYFAFLGVLIWLQVRFSLVFSLTLLRRKIIIGESWTLTKGRFWILFGAYFVLAVIMFVVLVTIGMITTAGYWSDLMQGGFSPEAMDAAAQRQAELQMAPDFMTILGWVLSGIFGGITIALVGGALATATRDLTGDVAGVADTFA